MGVEEPPELGLRGRPDAPRELLGIVVQHRARNALREPRVDDVELDGDRRERARAVVHVDGSAIHAVALVRAER